MTYIEPMLCGECGSEPLVLTMECERGMCQSCQRREYEEAMRDAPPGYFADFPVRP